MALVHTTFWKFVYEGQQSGCLVIYPTNFWQGHLLDVEQRGTSRAWVVGAMFGGIKEGRSNSGSSLYALTYMDLERLRGHCERHVNLSFLIAVFGHRLGGIQSLRRAGSEPDGYHEGHIYHQSHPGTSWGTRSAPFSSSRDGRCCVRRLSFVTEVQLRTPAMTKLILSLSCSSGCISPSALLYTNSKHHRCLQLICITCMTCHGCLLQELTALFLCAIDRHHMPWMFALRTAGSTCSSIGLHDVPWIFVPRNEGPCCNARHHSSRRIGVLCVVPALDEVAVTERRGCRAYHLVCGSKEARAPERRQKEVTTCGVVAGRCGCRHCGDSASADPSAPWNTGWRLALHGVTLPDCSLHHIFNLDGVDIHGKAYDIFV